MKITDPIAFIVWLTAWTALFYVFGWIHGQVSARSAGAKGEQRP